MNTKYKKWFAIGILLGLIIVAVPCFVYFIVLNQTLHTSSNKYTMVEIFQKYPTPKKLDDALLANKIDYHDLPVSVQQLIDLYRERNK